MSTIKVTPEQLHHVSNQVDQARQQLEHIREDLTRQIMFLQQMWLGVTQERFYVSLRAHVLYCRRRWKVW
ncbi:WXG100 family type VII secretion target [Paenibacillus sp. QZ-Y1]|uniref:WXG100 family type VII secretion target n=1 Tax=Paenibacillus sp. QZ-Y1 TaxID=3414511 RepID=UPI003F79DD87